MKLTNDTVPKLKFVLMVISNNNGHLNIRTYINLVLI